MQRFTVPFCMHRTGWILLMICVGIGIEVSGWRLGLPVAAVLVASLLLHEMGHMLVARLLWVPVREFGLKLGGAYTRRAYATRRRDEILISAAGPVVNLLLIGPLLLVPHIGAQLALGNMALCVVNLLPIPASDGLRILRALWYPGVPGAPVTVLRG